MISRECSSAPRQESRWPTFLREESGGGLPHSAGEEPLLGASSVERWEEDKTRNGAGLKPNDKGFVGQTKGLNL